MNIYEIVAIIYFAINIFFAGYMFSDMSHHGVLRRSFAAFLCVFLFIPIMTIDLWYELGKKLYWRFMNYFMIGVYRYYKQGKYKNLTEDQLERVRWELLNAKFGYQVRMLQSIIDDNSICKCTGTVMIQRNPDDEKAYCFECKKRIIE